jgi:hypothetical protein
MLYNNFLRFAAPGEALLCANVEGDVVVVVPAIVKLSSQL